MSAHLLALGAGFVLAGFAACVVAVELIDDLQRVRFKNPFFPAETPSRRDSG